MAPLGEEEGRGEGQRNLEKRMNVGLLGPTLPASLHATALLVSSCLLSKRCPRGWANNNHPRATILISLEGRSVRLARLKWEFTRVCYGNPPFGGAPGERF